MKLHYTEEVNELHINFLTDRYITINMHINFDGLHLVDEVYYV